MAAGWDVTDTGTGPIEFEIGMRWAQLWRLAARPWVPAAFAGMVRPSRNAGLLRTRVRVTPAGPAVVQLWRDRPAVDGWARDRAESHAQPWGRFAREAGGTHAWGIWHRVRDA
jgi:Domain of unknown function (DUF4188)